MSAPKKENLKRLSDPRVDRIWEVMNQRKMTIADIAKKSGLSYAHTNKVLNGVMELKPNLLEKIAVKGLKLPLSFFDEVTIENKLKPKESKKAQLMSEILSNVPNILRFVQDKIDVSGLNDFFTKEPTRPLIATGHGGKYSQAVYAALLYSTYKGLGRAVTCYSCNSLSDATIKNSKILLCSRGMANIDIDYIANRCLKLNPKFTCAMRVNSDFEEENKYAKTVEKLKESGYAFLYDVSDISLSENFIGISSVFFYSSILYKAFSGDTDFVSKLELNENPTENYTYKSADELATVPSLSNIKHFTVLYGSYAEPVAYNIESNIVESGIASCMISDYKNYTHGRFMVEGNYIRSKEHPTTEAALICLVTPREARIYEDLLAAMPPHLPIVTIRTDLITPLATVDLLYKANMFVSYLGEHFFKTNPNYPHNFSKIDKRIPKNGVDFKPDFNVFGALDGGGEKAIIKKLCGDLKVKADSLSDLMGIKKSMLETEAERTKKARKNWEKRKPLSWDDFSFRVVHEYDTSKQECWSFNRKDDVRDGINLKLGNMSNGYGVSMLGIDFPNSEVPYQLAIFNNEKDSIKLQEEIVDPQNGWIGRGLQMKRKYIYGREYKRFLRDTEFENGKEMWCFEWMKFVVWEKVRQNEEFKNILLSIPKEAIIIEQAQHKPQKDNPSMWGAWNGELKKEREILERFYEIEHGLSKVEDSVPIESVPYQVNNVGTFVGENSMGQILTMAKLALNEEINLPIDADMLNEAKINWFGKVLQFTKHEDGLVTVEAVVPKIGKAPSNGIIGAIVGDIQGSIYELQEDKDKIKKAFSKKDKKLSTNKQLSYTDDSVLTIATAKWLLTDKEHSKDTLIDLYQLYGGGYKPLTFADGFKNWVRTKSRKPYGSVCDGSAMRVSPIGYYAKNIKECLELARISAEVTHNTEEGIRGAQAIAAAIFLNRYGLSKKEIKQYLGELFPSYNLKRKIDTIRPKYEPRYNCDDVVPESILCFLEGKDYTETVNLAISFGGDTDTMACIGGSIAAVNNEVPGEAAQYAYEILPNEFRNVLDEFTKQYHKQPKSKLPKPSGLMDLVNVQPIEEETIDEVVEEVDEEEAELLIAESPTDTEVIAQSSSPIVVKPDITINGYDLYCLYNFQEANAFDKDTHWCYNNSEYMYERYTKKSGFLFVAAKKGYKEIEHLYGKGENRWTVRYDEYANSLFSLTTFINPKTNEVDVFSVTFRRNDTSRHYEGQHKDTYNEMMEKTKELLGGFDFGAYCIKKTKEHLGLNDKDNAETPQEPILKPTRAPKRKVKEIPTEEKKTSQKVRNQADSSDGRVKGIIGAVIGDIVGSRFEFSKPPTRKVDRFTTASTLTDDSVMTVAIADALLHGKDYMESMLEWGRKYPKAGYGNRFKQLLKGKKGLPTDSIANGSGMRVSPIGFYAKTLDEALERAKQSALPSHNSVEGIKGAQSIASAIFMAREQRPKEEIKAYIEKEFGYNLSQTDEEIKAHVSTLRHGDAKKGIPAEREFAENTCPLAIIAFLTTDDYESSIWKSISYGCDTDTVACMCGGIAAAYYGVPTEIINEVVEYLPREILSVINEFDHTSLQNRRITPKKYNRWGAVFVYGSGNDLLKDEKGHIIDEGGFDAKQDFGAKDKVKEGICNRSYAIPTMGKSLDKIKEAVDRFCVFAETNQEMTFMVIEIGCKKAGYTPKQIAPMFASIADLPNVYLPKEFREVLNTEEK